MLCLVCLQAGSLELVFDTMTCLFHHLGSHAVPMLPFLGSILHMLSYSLPAILGPVGAAEEGPGDDADQGSMKEDEGAVVAHEGQPVDEEPRSGAQATATYYAAVQFVRVSLDNQPANVRLFVMHGGVETFVELVGSAFQHAHSLLASTPSSNDTVATITSGDTTDPSHTGSDDSEENFSSAISVHTGATKSARRERASDMSVALTCRELVVECISCLSSALEVRGSIVDKQMHYFISEYLC